MEGSMHDVVQLSGALSSGTLNGSLASTESLSASVSIPRSMGGTNDYNRLVNKPSIESVELQGNKTFGELGISSIDADDLIEILS